MTVAFATASALVWVTVGLLLTTFAATFSIFARFVQKDIVHHGVPMVIAITTFALLQFNPKVTTWAEEVIVELKKVVWPSRQQTVAMTIVVVVMVMISGIALGGFDLLSGQAISSGIGVLQTLFR